jgi:hypothetical protein
MRAALLAALAAAGCFNLDVTHHIDGGADGPGPGDLLGAPPGDGSSDGAPADAARSAPCSVDGTLRTKLVVSTVTVPSQPSAFKLDLNGDGNPKNRYANIVGAFASQGTLFGDDQTALQATVTAGSNLLLLEIDSRDPALQNDACAGARLEVGAATASPDFGGSGLFSVDPGFAPSSFSGPLVAGAFDSASPATTTMPVSMAIELSFGGVVVRVPIIGAHLQFSVAGGRASGQLNGAIRNADMQATVIPAMATAYTNEIAQNPTSSNSLQLKSLFDTGCAGTCKNPDGSCAVSGDSRIDPCEVRTNPIINNVLAPDVQMFTTDGATYMPFPGSYAGLDMAAPLDMSGAPSTLDSLSIGIGFSAVGATF